MGQVLFRRGVRRRPTPPRYGRHSDLYRWLYARHDTILKGTDGGQVSWDALGLMVSQAGIRDGRGNPPSNRRMSRAFAMVKRDVAKARGAQQPKPRAAAIIPGNYADNSAELRGRDVCGRDVDAAMEAVEARLARRKQRIPEVIR